MGETTCVGFLLLHFISSYTVFLPSLRQERQSLKTKTADKQVKGALQGKLDIKFKINSQT